ncbi:MAG: multidrug effflux MFS transporter [Gammaproteobacteria bacterium]|nr:multidrug effflux MFS transporter [Gammaproteobacteria bacterium]
MQKSLWIPVLLIIYNFAANLANDIYLPSLPLLVKMFSTTDATLQFTMTAWFAGVAIPQLFLGPLTDKIGRRPILFGGGICFLISTLACASANNVWVLIVARFFQGVGVCSLNVTTFSILIDLYEYKYRVQVMNKISICGTASPLLGPIIGGYILTLFGWRYNFLVIFLLGLISLTGLWFKLPESNLFLNVHAMNYRYICKNYYLILTTKSFVKHLLPYCLLLGGLIVYLTAAPFIIISQLKFSPQYFGYTQLPVFASYILGGIYVSYLTEETQLKNILKIGIKLVFISGIILLLCCTFYTNSIYAFILPMMLYALGFSFCTSTLVTEVMSLGGEMRGYSSALLGFGMAVSCVLASGTLGLLYNGAMVSVALLIFVISGLAFLIYTKDINKQ